MSYKHLEKTIWYRQVKMQFFLENINELDIWTLEMPDIKLPTIHIPCSGDEPLPESFVTTARKIVDDYIDNFDKKQILIRQSIKDFHNWLSV